METLKKLSVYALIISLSIGLFSCEKSEIETSESSLEEEGFKSTTGNSDTESLQFETLEGEIQMEAKPLIIKYYPESFTEEEATAQFEKDSKHLMEEYRKKGVSTEWFYRVNIRTGTQSNNTTNGRVSSYVRFRTDKGYVSQRYTLPNAGRNPGWVYYVADTYYPGKAVSWVEIHCTQLALRGTDAWFPTNYNVGAGSWFQNVPATGNTRINASPNVWLDSNCSTCWDTYWTCNSSLRQRLNF